MPIEIGSGYNEERCVLTPETLENTPVFMATPISETILFSNPDIGWNISITGLSKENLAQALFAPSRNGKHAIPFHEGSAVRSREFGSPREVILERNGIKYPGILTCKGIGLKEANDSVVKIAKTLETFGWEAGSLALDESTKDHTIAHSAWFEAGAYVGVPVAQIIVPIEVYLDYVATTTGAEVANSIREMRASNELYNKRALPKQVAINVRFTDAVRMTAGSLKDRSQILQSYQLWRRIVELNDNGLGNLAERFEIPIVFFKHLLEDNPNELERMQIELLLAIQVMNKAKLSRIGITTQISWKDIGLTGRLHDFGTAYQRNVYNDGEINGNTLEAYVAQILNVGRRNQQSSNPFIDISHVKYLFRSLGYSMPNLFF